MLPIYGHKRSPLCDGISRRDVLKVGALGAGLTLTDLLRAEAAQGVESSKKSVIMVYMVGAPPHDHHSRRHPRRVHCVRLQHLSV